MKEDYNTRGLSARFDIQSMDIEHYKASDRYASLISRVMYSATEDIARIIAKGGYDESKPFDFKDYPAVKKQVDFIISDMTSKMQMIVSRSVSNEWMRAVKKGDSFIDSIIKTSKLSKEQIKALKPRNLQALKAFQDRKVRGLKLSARIWEVSEQYKSQMEYAIDVGIGEGKGAIELARDIKKYLRDPDKLFRRVRDERGNLQLSKAAKAFHPGQGKYRSSVRNAQRVARTEANSAYRESDYKRWQSMDIILGFEVRRSKREPVFKCKVCEKLVGRYPKTFKFTGWHPNCYSSDTEVYTNRGWQLFKDVTKDDLILSLNPNSKETEWVAINKTVSYHYNGCMIKFHNEKMDLLVTPDHKMVYVDNGHIKRDVEAKDFDGVMISLDMGEIAIYNKNYVPYNGEVYDVELERNHILYVRRNGKCVWGSNCMCYAVPILMSPDELAKKQKHDLKQAIKGTYKRYVPSRPVTDLPPGYKEWISENAKRMEGWSSKPYFIQDNYKYGDISKGLKYNK